MALTQKKFENPDEDNPETGAEHEAAEHKPTPAERAAEAAKAHASTTAETKAVATQKPAGNAVTVAKLVNPFEQLKDVFKVEFNTLSAVMATQGNFVNKDSNKPLGDKVGLQLISWQNHWVLSPGSDDEESLEFVKYSDDGVTVNGSDQTMIEALADAKAAGYDKARITERTILVGSLFDSGKLADMKDAIIQIDLPPTSMAHFKRHQLQVAFQSGRGMIPADQDVTRLVMECTLKTKGKNTWTEVIFSTAK